MTKIAETTEVTLEQSAGLSPWFFNTRNPTIDRICWAGDAAVWSDRVKYVLDCNQYVKDGRPQNWSALAEKTGGTAGNFSRYQKPEDAIKQEKRPQVADTLLRHRVAVVLGSDDRKLSPSTLEWIARSTQLLLRKFRTRELEGLHSCAIAIYAGYVYQSITPTVIDKQRVEAVTCVCKHCKGPEKLSATQIVAQAVGEILIELHSQVSGDE